MLISQFNFFDRKAHTRKSKSGKSVPVKKSRIKGKEPNRLQQAAIIGSVGAAVGVGGFLAVRTRAIKNLDTSANWVSKNFDKFDFIQDNSAKRLKQPSAMFTIPGLWNKDNPLIKSMAKGQLKFKGAIIHNPIDSMIKDMPKTENMVRQIPLVYSHEIKKQIQLGYNPVARETAARAYAFHKAYPDKNLNFMGHSWGGSTANETVQILERLGVPKEKMNLITLGSDHYRILPKADIKRVDIVDKNDYINTPLPFKGSLRDTRTEDTIKAHGIHAYANQYKNEIKKSFI